MVVVNMHEAKTNLSRLVERVERGEEIVIGRHGTPVARLVPYAAKREPRRAGRLAGRLLATADFDQTPEWVVDAFEGPAT